MHAVVTDAMYEGLAAHERIGCTVVKIEASLFPNDEAGTALLHASLTSMDPCAAAPSNQPNGTVTMQDR